LVESGTGTGTLITTRSAMRSTLPLVSAEMVMPAVTADTPGVTGVNGSSP